MCMYLLCNITRKMVSMSIEIFALGLYSTVISVISYKAVPISDHARHWMNSLISSLRLLRKPNFDIKFTLIVMISYLSDINHFISIGNSCPFHHRENSSAACHRAILQVTIQIHSISCCCPMVDRLSPVYRRSSPEAALGEIDTACINIIDIKSNILDVLA